jgi:hypothetical protein
MVTHTSRRATLAAACGAIAILASAVGCDKVPLLAPTGSVISLFATATTVPVNGETEIIANVIENGVAATPPTTPGTGNGNGTPGTTTPGTTTTTNAGAGTPVQNGTLVSFTTTIGRIEPSEARTTNGQVRVKFIAAGQSGTATITAFSGGASGRLENLRVGAAGAERVLVTASPQTLAPSGGTTTIVARVEDASGSGLPGLPVTFSTDAGTFSSSSALTDSSGNATTTLSTTRAAKVTANVAGKTAEVNIGLNPRTGITLTGPTTPVSAGQPATFTVGVGSTANVQNVTVNFGDGSSQSLGAISGSTTVSHTYDEADTYNVRATATEASGFTEQVATSVTILPGQPPSVIVSASPANPTVNARVTLTATVSGATSTIQSYQWDFGDGRTATTTSPQIQVSYAQAATYTVIVTVNQATGPSGQGLTTITVTP